MPAHPLAPAPGLVGGGGRAVVGQLAALGRELLDEVEQLARVGQVAVVAQRDRPGRGRPERRLGVLPHAGAGGGVAGVADREVAAQRAEVALVEDLRDQAHVLVDQDLRAVAHRDAGRLLAAVLQRVEAEVGQLGDLGLGAGAVGGPDAEDPAGVLRALLAGNQVVSEPTVATWHGRQSTGARPGCPTGSPDAVAAGTVTACGAPARRRPGRRAARRARPAAARGRRTAGPVVDRVGAHGDDDDRDRQSDQRAGQQEAQVPRAAAGVPGTRRC